MKRSYIREITEYDTIFDKFQNPQDFFEELKIMHNDITDFEAKEILVVTISCMETLMSQCNLEDNFFIYFATKENINKIEYSEKTIKIGDVVIAYKENDGITLYSLVNIKPSKDVLCELLFCGTDKKFHKVITIFNVTPNSDGKTVCGECWSLND